MCEQMYQTIRVPLKPTNFKLQSPDKIKLTVLGEVVTPLNIYIEHIRKSIKLRPVVVRDLACHLNICVADLKDNRAIIDFTSSPPTLTIQGDTTDLIPSTRSLMDQSVDPLFAKVQEKCRELNLSPQDGLLKVTKEQGEEKGVPYIPVVHQVDQTERKRENCKD